MGWNKRLRVQKLASAFLAWLRKARGNKQSIFPPVKQEKFPAIDVGLLNKIAISYERSVKWPLLISWMGNKRTLTILIETIQTGTAATRATTKDARHIKARNHHSRLGSKIASRRLVPFSRIKRNKKPNDIKIHISTAEMKSAECRPLNPSSCSELTRYKHSWHLEWNIPSVEGRSPKNKKEQERKKERGKFKRK